MSLDNHFFDSVFNEVDAYVMRDFSNIQTQSNDEGKRKFCLFTCQSVFNIVVDNLINKEKFSGEICLPEKIPFGAFKADRIDVIKSNKEYKKGKLSITERQSLMYNINYKRTEERIEKISKLREHENKTRITIFPLEGGNSFFYSMADFSVAIIIETKAANDSNFTIEKIFIHNPISRNSYSFSKDGITLNGTKITDNSENEKNINAFYINDGINNCHFDITKLASKVPFFATSASIFLTICNIAVNRNFVAIYSNEDTTKSQYLDFMIKNSYLSAKKIGSHLMIGKMEILSKIVK